MTEVHDEAAPLGAELFARVLGLPTTIAEANGRFTHVFLPHRTGLLPLTPFMAARAAQEEAELRYRAQRNDLAILLDCAPADIEAAALRDPGGFAALRERVLMGGPLEWQPFWMHELFARPLPRAAQLSLTLARAAGCPIRKGRPVWRAHTPKRWGQHG